ncbi:bifunctional serine/threonine-protein kinase/formylglycine-generating enzyme family protein [Schlesneria paludicola]|uniref:bifunctional serine/threonine-protein kinase/formylglycine-generating enzyme family protein n=1 Tax=Schlesneria paludicola TaxID=360056 RepID=UPI00029B4244|nr:bifunctional serine/threonine-protein kinase/formylglycine-generating enzyme family protein [Schlesneria paludicola]
MNQFDAMNKWGLKERFAKLWQQGGDPPDIFRFLEEHGDLPVEDAAEVCVIDQINRWRGGIGLPVEEYVSRLPRLQQAPDLTLKLVQAELLRRCDPRRKEDVDQFIRRFPQFTKEICDFAAGGESPTIDPLQIGNNHSLDPTVAERPAKVEDPAFESRPTRDVSKASGENALPSYKPAYIGRYEIVRLLGDGGFGRVWLAKDGRLERNVAIKIPHRHRALQQKDIEGYLTEARILSSLQHHAIVSVFDCGKTDDGLWYVVSQYIDGCDLANKVKRTPLSVTASAELVISLAEALEHAHSHGVVHRDVKPANILIDGAGRPYLADFGIALREVDYGTGYTMLGTLAYMSPEQCRGEGHLVDGRSDLFSLGIVFYELLTGQRPFSANRLDSSAATDPKPPRQIDDAIPREIERICLKAMAYRVVDRYAKTIEMASDLRSFLQLGPVQNGRPERIVGLSGQGITATSGNQFLETGVHIEPKGLRSFDRNDAGFFLELLPGPRDRNGLPESVKFWKERIEAVPAETFRVGVIYGPSGCGKSSFLKAGVLPQLGDSVLPVYVESTPIETETRLLKSIRKACPELSNELGLADSMAALRRQSGGDAKPRILIVIDQFEQWLHSRPKDEACELVRAIRQCDGNRLQCLITVRDDFWMALTNFMHDVEVRLIPESNLAAVDLFSLRHATKVLTALGHAYHILPPNPGQIDSEQKAFIRQAVSELATNDKVIPVQLSLFAEMFKDKSWSLATLKDVGGTEGVGVAFLEETFNGRAASPLLRLHQKAARAVLRALLPDDSTGIKGQMRSYEELLEISGYSDTPEELSTLLHLLDCDLRLIAPTDPEGLDTQQATVASSLQHQGRYYHLTHDYLVPSLQEWLTRKQKETRKGRAELLLADRAAVWSKKPSNRTLPSFFEWISILAFAGKGAKRESRQVLRRSRAYYGTRGSVAALILFAVFFGVRSQVAMARATAMVESLLSARADDVPKIIESLKPYRAIANPLLQSIVQSPDSGRAPRLHAAMALFPVDRTQEESVYAGLLSAAPDEFLPICGGLASWGDCDELIPRMWGVLRDPQHDAGQRLRAAVGVANVDHASVQKDEAHWREVSGFVVKQLVAEVGKNLGRFDQWVAVLRPVRSVLFFELDRVFSKLDESDVDRYVAAMILADFAADDPPRLVDLAVRATEKEYQVFVPRLKAQKDTTYPLLIDEYKTMIPEDVSRDERFRIGKRKAHAAVALMEFDQFEPMQSFLVPMSADPTISSYVENRISKLATRPESLIRMLEIADVNFRSALLRMLAKVSIDQLPPDLRQGLIRIAANVYAMDPNPGVHSAAEWALKNWNEVDQLGRLHATISEKPELTRDWYRNKRGITMLVFREPTTVMVGSPPGEFERDASDEAQVLKTISRTFALSATEITLKDFLEFLPDFRHKGRTEAPTEDCPVSAIPWHHGAEFCLFLSRLEGIPEDQYCYRKDGDDLIPYPDYLHRTGYRLPTEAEWEYVCRAGAVTAFTWGDDLSIANHYAYTIQNGQGHPWPVGSLCPNRFGAFDMHGNVAEWVHDRYQDVRVAGDDTEEEIDPDEESAKVVKGSSFGDFISRQRSANRLAARARTQLSVRIGFRIARTIATDQASQ